LSGPGRWGSLSFLKFLESQRGVMTIFQANLVALIDSHQSDVTIPEVPALSAAQASTSAIFSQTAGAKAGQVNWCLSDSPFQKQLSYSGNAMLRLRNCFLIRVFLHRAQCNQPRRAGRGLAPPRLPTHASRHKPSHGHRLDISPPAAVFLTANDDRNRFYGDSLHLSPVYSAASLINCSACFSASAVTLSPESMRPISLVRCAGVSSTIVASVLPRSSCFST
jgi:hypothetical protein